MSHTVSDVVVQRLHQWGVETLRAAARAESQMRRTKGAARQLFESILPDKE